MEFVDVKVKEMVRKGIKVPSAGHVLAIFLVLPTRYGRASRLPTIFISFTGMRTICDLTCFAIWIFHAPRVWLWPNLTSVHFPRYWYRSDSPLSNACTENNIQLTIVPASYVGPFRVKNKPYQLDGSSNFFFFLDRIIYSTLISSQSVNVKISTFYESWRYIIVYKYLN